MWSVFEEVSARASTTARVALLVGATLLSACGAGTGQGGPTASSEAVKPGGTDAANVDAQGAAAPAAESPATPIDPPAAPTLSATGTSGALKLSWTAANGATSYVVQKRLGDTGTWTDEGAALDATATASDRKVPVAEWSRARYRVKGCNAAGCTVSAELEALAPMRATPLELPVSGEMFAISADGTTVATGSGDSVSIAVRENGVWRQQASLSMPPVSTGTRISSLAMSADGALLAVGRTGEEEIVDFAGEVHVFGRSAVGWSRTAVVQPTDSAPYDMFGFSVALSSNGATLAVGANNASGSEGRAYVFDRSGSGWAQRASLSSPGSQGFGSSIAIAADGTTVAASERGRAVRVYVLESGTWQVRSTLPAGGATPALAMSSDGRTIAVGGGSDGGPVAVYRRDAAGWSNPSYFSRPSGAGFVYDMFGYALSISGDGQFLLVGDIYESGGATGLDGDPTRPFVAFESSSGAAHVFAFDGTAWTRKSYLKPLSGGTNFFGASVAMSVDGSAIVVGAGGAGPAVVY